MCERSINGWMSALLHNRNPSFMQAGSRASKGRIRALLYRDVAIFCELLHFCRHISCINTRLHKDRGGNVDRSVTFNDTVNY